MTVQHTALAELCLLARTQATFTVKEVEVLVQHSPLNTYIAIRGTELYNFFGGNGWRDVLRDLRVLPWHDKQLGFCHSGFLKGAKRVQSQLYLNKSKKIIVTGHSMGAAIGQLLALKLHFAGYRVEFIGFGMPRHFIGSRIFDMPATHYRHADDPVSELPPRWLFNFRHWQPYVTLAKKDRQNGIAEHAIENYINALEAHP